MTPTDSSGWVTVSDDEPEIPDNVAEILAVPADIAVARPVEEIVATAVLDDTQAAELVTS
jgi:hypothetical protein